MAEGEYTFQTSANFFLCVLQNPLNGLSTSTKRVRRTKHKGAFSGADALQCLEDLGLTRSSARQIANHLLEAGHIQRISGRESIRFEDDPNTWYIFTYYPTHPNTYLTKSLHKAAACMLAVATKSDVLDGHQLPSPSGGSPSSSFAPSLSSSASSSSLLMRESQMASDMIAGRHSQLKPEEILAEDGDNIIFDLDPHSGLPSVKAASVEKLVKYLTNPKLGCVKFRNAFLLTYSSFMAADELLRSLGDRFLIAPTPADAQDMERWEVDFRKPIQLRVFGVLRTWIQRHETDFIDNPELVTKIKNLANTVIAPVSPFWKQNADGLIKHLDRIHTRSEQAAQGLQKTVPILPEGRLTPGEFTFEDLHVLEFARQLTLLEARLYRRIRAVELLENAWNTPSKKTRAPHVIELIDNFNCISRWTTGEIVSRATLAARVSTISWFIQLAIRLKELNNFNGVMEILSGLNSSAVRRLKKTWAEIPPPLLAVFHEIETVMSHNGNFKDYRECLHSAKPPCLPYLGVYLTDLTFISEGNPDTERGLVNFRKRLRIAQVIEEIQQYQKEEYPITEVPTIMQYISKLDGCPEQKAYEFSITVEGTNTEEAIAKLLLNEKILNEKIQLLENRIVALEEENAALRKESKVAQKFKSRAARDSKAISFMASSLAEIQQSKSENSSSSSTTSPSSSTTSRSSSFSSTSSSNSESQSNSSGDAVPRRTIRRPTLLAQVLPIATPVIKSPPVPESITLQRTEVRYRASTLPPPERISFASVVKSQLSESAGENKSTNSSPTATTDGPKSQRQSAEVRPPVTEASTSAQSSAILSSSDNGSSSTLLASSSSEGEQATTPKLSPSTSTESLPESGGPPKLPERRPPAMTVSVAPRMLPTGRPPARTSTMSVPANPEEVDEGEELKKIASVASHTFGAATAAIQARRSFRGPRRRGGPGGPGGVGMTDSSDFSESLGAEEGDQEPVSPRDTPLGPVGTPPHLGAVGTPPSFRGRGGMRGRGFATSPGGSSGDILRPPSNPSE